MADEMTGSELAGLEGETTATQTQQQTQQQQKTEEKKTDDNADLKAAMTELAGTVKTLAEKDKGGEKELTQDEINEAWAIYDPEKSQKDFFRKFFRLNPEATDEDVKAMKELFADMQKGLVRQAVVGARNVLMPEFAKVREETKPLMDYFTERKSKETREDFNAAYPALADEKYTKIINAIAKSLKQEDFKTNEEYFKALAEGAADVINVVRKEAGQEEIDLSKVEEKKKTAATTPKLPRSSVGGTGGTGGGPQKDAGEDGTRNDLDSIS